VTDGSPRVALLDELTVPIVVHSGVPATVAAACDAGALGVLSTEYEGAERFLADARAARAATSRPVGACVYAAGGATGDPARFEAYALSWTALPGGGLGRPRFGDTTFEAQLAGLERDPLDVVEIAAGLPPRRVVDDLHRAGSEVWPWAGSPDDARRAAALGADALVVHGDDVLGLLPQIAAAVDLPLVAGGRIATGRQVAAARVAGAAAAQVQSDAPDVVAQLAGDARAALDGARLRVHPPAPEGHPS
jgi:nitronate monooxygenase